MADIQLSKFFNCEVSEFKRSEIRFAEYNPRILDDDAKKEIKKGIKRFGLMGGLIINKGNNNTIVQGHQRITCLDELHKFNPETLENDYVVRAEVIDVDEKTEKEINILLNNPNVAGRFNFDKLAELLPDVDYKNTGLTEADLNMIGVDFLLQTEEENNLSDALEEMMRPANEQRQREVEQRAEQRAASKAEQAELRQQIEENQEVSNEEQAAIMAQKVQHMKDVKQQVKEEAASKVQNMEAYLMLSFDTFEAKAAFLGRFGHDPYTKVLKGEIFDAQVEVIYADEDF